MIFIFFALTTGIAYLE